MRRIVWLCRLSSWSSMNPRPENCSATQTPKPATRKITPSHLRVEPVIKRMIAERRLISHPAPLTSYMEQDIHRGVGCRCLLGE